MTIKSEKKILLITFSDNADHQDITFGMFEELYPNYNIWLMCINNPRVSLDNNTHVRLVDCPKKPGLNIDTFKLHILQKEIFWIKKMRFDVVFFETLHTWNLPIMLNCGKNTKVFQMIHDVVPHDGDKLRKQVDLMNKIVCKLSDYIVLVNEKYVEKLTKKYRIADERVKHIDMWRRFPKYTEPQYTGTVLFFGRLNPYKGVDNLLEIVNRCPEIRFSVVGRIDPQVQDIVDELKRKNNVELITGYVTEEEMEKAFIGSDWVILPYNSATQSGVVIDAYRYSRPVIAYNVGALAEQIIDGESGYLIEPGNLDEFIQKIKLGEKMPQSLYKQLSIKSYNYGFKKYAVSEARDRFLDVIDL